MHVYTTRYLPHSFLALFVTNSLISATNKQSISRAFPLYKRLRGVYMEQFKVNIKNLQLYKAINQEHFHSVNQSELHVSRPLRTRNFCFTLLWEFPESIYSLYCAWLAVICIAAFSELR